MADFRVGDCFISLGYGGNFLTGDPNYIFDGIPSSEVTPSHFWIDEQSKMMRIK